MKSDLSLVLFLGCAVLAIAVASIIGVSIVSSPRQIFRVAVYQYAVTGETASGFDGQLLHTAFVRRS
jgi:hypothetical protein